MSENISITTDNAVVRAVVNQVKSDMRGGAKYAAYVTEFGVTRETVKDHALAIARLVTPETAQKKDGKRTRFGNAVQAAGNGLRAALDKNENEKQPTTKNLLTATGIETLAGLSEAEILDAVMSEIVARAK